jgi:HEAT repeat protein/MFS family permease
MTAPLSRLDTIRALKQTQYEAALATVFGALTGGVFLTGYALWLRASEFWIGVLAMIPPLVGLAQPLASFFVERRGERKGFVMLTAGVGRGLWLLMLPVGFVLPAAMRLPAFFVVFVSATLLIMLSGAPYVSWLTDLVPTDQRGRFFSHRFMVITGTAAVATIPFSRLVDLLPERAGFPLVFGIGIVFAAVAFSYTVRIPEPQSRERRDPHRGLMLGEFFAAPFRDRRFRPLLVFLLVFNFSSMIYGNFVIVFLRESLGFSFTWTNVYTVVVPSTAALLSFSRWGYLADRYGSRPVGGIGLFMAMAWPPIMFLSPWVHGVYRHLLIGFAQTWGGVFSGALMVSHFNLMIGASPRAKRTAYIAGATALLGISGALAPFLGGVIMQVLRDFRYAFTLPSPFSASLTLEPFQILALTSIAVRSATPFLYRYVPDPHAVSAREVFDQLRSPATLTGLVHLRKLTTSGHEEERVRAARALGDKKTGLAVDELVKALDDSSHHMREEAARSLGEIGDRAAVPVLVAKLKERDVRLAYEAAVALGRIGDPAAIDPLMELLNSPEPALRRAACYSLGSLHADRAGPRLLDVVRSGTSDQEVECAEAAIVGLGRMRYREAVPYLADVLGAYDRRIKIAAANALAEIGDAAALERLIAALDAETDYTTLSAFAEAIASMRDYDAIGELYAMMDRTTSKIERGQIAYVIGAIIGDRDEFYSLLALDEYTREVAVARMVGGLGKRAVRLSGDARCRGLAAASANAHATQRYEEMVFRLKELVESGAGPPPDDPRIRAARRLLEDTHRKASREELTPEEALLAVYAAKQSLSVGEARRQADDRAATDPLLHGPSVDHPEE